jgi:hypothetical protein
MLAGVAEIETLEKKRVNVVVATAIETGDRGYMNNKSIHPNQTKNILERETRIKTPEQHTGVYQTIELPEKRCRHVMLQIEG